MSKNVGHADVRYGITRGEFFVSVRSLERVEHVSHLASRVLHHLNYIFEKRGRLRPYNCIALPIVPSFV